MIWKKTLNHCIEILGDLSDTRFQIVKMSAAGIPLIIINVYLPTTTQEAEYDNCLENLLGLLPVLGAQAPVVLTGDWNASLGRATPTARDKKFGSFVTSAGLTPASYTTP